MAKTPEQKRDAYYRKKYGVGLDWYDAKFAEQEGCCGICRRPQSDFTKRFAVDHDHGWKKVKIGAFKDQERWSVWASYLGCQYVDFGPKKADLIRKLKETLRILSCRGLLCPFCNRGLRYYSDCPNRLQNAAIYLRKHQNAK